MLCYVNEALDRLRVRSNIILFAKRLSKRLGINV